MRCPHSELMYGLNGCPAKDVGVAQGLLGQRSPELLLVIWQAWHPALTSTRQQLKKNELLQTAITPLFIMLCIACGLSDAVSSSIWSWVDAGRHGPV